MKQLVLPLTVVLEQVEADDIVWSCNSEASCSSGFSSHSHTHTNTHLHLVIMASLICLLDNWRAERERERGLLLLKFDLQKDKNCV